MARPSSFQPEFCQKAAELCARGATDAELAEYFEVSTRTIYRWQSEFPEFCQALKLGKTEADERVERSLYHKAIRQTRRRRFSGSRTDAQTIGGTRVRRS
jgi:hypothetical protein